MIEESYILYGTPLDSKQRDGQVSHKVQRISDQIVTDDRGKRRFHGAFTGGFSAGFFNSVGSEAGWKPSSFVSSRSGRAHKDEAYNRPETFMDEEDFSEHGIAPQKLKASDNYAAQNIFKRKRVLDTRDALQCAPLLEDLLQPSVETFGKKLLYKLGWRPGQGIGPRVLQKQEIKRSRRKFTKEKPINESPGSEDEHEESDQLDCMLTFTELQRDSFGSETKTNLFGLGYKPHNGGDKCSQSDNRFTLFEKPSLSFTHNKKKVSIAGQAFGVGAFEDDDDDIYAKDDLNNYDFTLDSEFQTEVHKAKHNSNISSVALQRENLCDFQLASFTKLCIECNYPLPLLPADFVPTHKTKRRFDLSCSEQQGLGRHELTADQRSKIIGDQCKVQVLCGLKPNSIQSSEISDTKKPMESIRSCEFSNNKEHIFKPFASDDDKQKRYETYLAMKQKLQLDKFSTVQSSRMTEWDKEKEKQEFERVSLLFKPLSFSMASRFTTSSQESNQEIFTHGLHLDPKKLKQNDDSVVSKDTNIAMSDRFRAANTVLYGRLTQTKEEWHPDPLLAKRFNVPDPFPNSQKTGTFRNKDDDKTVHSLFGDILKQNEVLLQEQKEDAAGEENTSNISKLPQDNYGLKVPTEGPPTLDLFKAIFEDSDDSSSEDESNTNIAQEKEASNDTLEKTNTTASYKMSTTSDQKPKKILEQIEPNPMYKPIDQSLKMYEKSNAIGLEENHNTLQDRDHSTKTMAGPSVKSAFGIFKDVDFEELNKHRYHVHNENKSQDISNDGRQRERNSSPVSSESDHDAYGPPLPPGFENNSLSIIKSSSYNLNEKKNYKDSTQGHRSNNSSKFQWVEKKSKKIKKHKHKTKHKKHTKTKH